MPKDPSRRDIVLKSYKARADARRSLGAKVADWLTAQFGTVGFLALNAIWFIVWIVWNCGAFGLKPFDPFPFGFLTMAVSLEAIFLAVIVLISQNRAAHIADIREEAELQISMINEAETTKTMELLCRLLSAQGIDVSNDEALSEMLKPTQEKMIEEVLEREIP